MEGVRRKGGVGAVGKAAEGLRKATGKGRGGEETSTRRRGGVRHDDD